MGKSDKKKEILRAPCKDCRERAIGCHATCERYISYQEQKKKIHDYRDPYADYLRKKKGVPGKFMNGR